MQTEDVIGAAAAVGYGLFIDTVAGHGRLTADALRTTEAGLYFGDAAVAAGLADAVATLQDLLGEAPPDALGDEAHPEDVAFFRNYMGMTPEDRENYRRMMELFRGQKGK